MNRGETFFLRMGRSHGPIDFSAPNHACIGHACAVPPTTKKVVHRSGAADFARRRATMDTTRHTDKVVIITGGQTESAKPPSNAFSQKAPVSLPQTFLRNDSMHCWSARLTLCR